MKRSLLLPWLRSWSRRSYLLHGILIAQMIWLPCSNSFGNSTDSDPFDQPTADPANNGGSSSGNDPEPPNPPTPDPEPPTPDPEPEPPLNPQEDADGDGLTNADENAAESDPHNPDTDHDGLTDNDEITLTGTDPISTDSNGDGVSDYNQFYGNTSVDEDILGPGETPYDHDGDGINDPVDPDPLSPDNDPDSDGDYVPDSQDTDPTDPTEWNDANNNGTNDDAEIPNNDTDGDGISNETDSHPTDPSLYNDWSYNGTNDENEDWDGDGVSNLQDSHPDSNTLWCDWNGNGVNDDSEAGTADSDGDGYSDNSDSHSYNSSLWEDWNYNGTNDSQDSQDSDGDGHNDSSDSDPQNNSLWEDWNRNSTNDSQETTTTTTTDRDNDGYSDSSDSDPDNSSLWEDWNRNGANDSTETTQPPSDSDGDGYPDGSDTDPIFSHIWEDHNRNGYNDSNEGQFIDNDGDGRANAFDTHPNDSSLWNDQNSNGQNDETEITITDSDGDGYQDSSDSHPNDPNLWNDRNGNNTNDELELPPDRDGDGISDNEDQYPDDYDNDGLSDADEISRGTNPSAQDSDNDGLNDGQEIYIGSNPLQVDTDGDGLTDFEEVYAYQTDPLSATTITFNQPPSDPPPSDPPPSDPSPSDPPPSDPPPSDPPPSDPPPSQAYNKGKTSTLGIDKGIAALTTSLFPPSLRFLKSLVVTLPLSSLSAAVPTSGYYKPAPSSGWLINQTASLTDSDEDGIPDRIEDLYAPLVVTPNGDLDGDGITNLQEYNAGTNMKEFVNSDFDGDGLTDVTEDRWSRAYSLNKFKFSDAFEDPDGDGLLTVEELNRTWGYANNVGTTSTKTMVLDLTAKIDPTAVATNPFQTTTGPNTHFGTRALTYNLTTRQPPIDTNTNTRRWSWRSPTNSYKNWMNDGLLRKACQESAVNNNLPSNFFTINHRYLVPVTDSSFTPVTQINGFDHLPLGYLNWLTTKEDAQNNKPTIPASAAASTNPINSPDTVTQGIINGLKPAASGTEGDIDGDLLPNYWEAGYRFNWRNSTNASLTEAKKEEAINAKINVSLTSQFLARIGGFNQLKVEIQEVLNKATEVHFVLGGHRFAKDSNPDGSMSAGRSTFLIKPYLLTAPKVPRTPAATATDELINGWKDAFIDSIVWQISNELDPDHDGLVNADEYDLNLSPLIPDYSGTSDRDSDGDGFTDAFELLAGSNALNKSSIPPFKLTMVSGNRQTGIIHQTLPAQLVAQVTYDGPTRAGLPANTPIPNVTLNAAASSNFSLIAMATETQGVNIDPTSWQPMKIQLKADAEGKIRFAVKLPHTPVANFGYQVTLSSLASPIRSLTFSATIRVPSGDTDGDGMPDAWEIANKLNHKSALDSTASPMHYGYHRDTPTMFQTEICTSGLAGLWINAVLLRNYTSPYTAGMTVTKLQWTILLVIDPDHDGVPNLTEFNNNKNPQVTDPVFGIDDDFDQDGFTDFEEWQAGSDMYSNLSQPMLELIWASGENQTVVQGEDLETCMAVRVQQGIRLIQMPLTVSVTDDTSIRVDEASQWTQSFTSSTDASTGELVFYVLASSQPGVHFIHIESADGLKRLRLSYRVIRNNDLVSNPNITFPPSRLPVLGGNERPFPLVPTIKAYSSTAFGSASGVTLQTTGSEGQINGFTRVVHVSSHKEKWERIRSSSLENKLQTVREKSLDSYSFSSKASVTSTISSPVVLGNRPEYPEFKSVSSGSYSVISTSDYSWTREQKNELEKKTWSGKYITATGGDNEIGFKDNHELHKKMGRQLKIIRGQIYSRILMNVQIML